MANTVSAAYSFIVKASETIDLGQDLIDGNPTVIHQITGLTGTLNATSTVPATTVSSDTRDLTAGAYTLDLTAAPSRSVDGSTTTVDFTGLKIQLFQVQNASDNTATVVVSDFGTDGYNVFGDSSGQVTIPVGGSIHFEGNDALADVASGAKNISFTSGDADATISFLIVGG